MTVDLGPWEGLQALIPGPRIAQFSHIQAGPGAGTIPCKKPFPLLIRGVGAYINLVHGPEKSDHQKA